MRIELPSNPWADALHRADDDVHTLTLSAPATNEWHAGFREGTPLLALRTEVAAPEPVTITLTF